MNWVSNDVGKVPRIKEAVLVEGLPGIGNVGKVAVDFLIEELKAKKFLEFFSYSLPHSVFVNENNLVELPSIALYHKKVNGKDIVLLAGDAQPIDERASYEFSEFVIDTIRGLGCREIVTLGGIGLPTVPSMPKVYCTGNCPEIVKKYTEGVSVRKKLYGIVGPVVGVSGLLLGLSKRKNIKAASLLAETYGHPMYLGLRGARELVKVLDKKLGLSIDIKGLDKEISEIEAEINRKSTGKKPTKSTIKKIQEKLGKEVSYIG